ncbi:DUF2188 domain-containing protein [Asticcacaulis benevestitus]|uniref:DUF2188 domain-containing protein n=1 Tax=Asticcacaulis benevestitus DSM 16100 = ATCC BAA-896 TaxID=1121022 RepID=V4Q2I9_9CAUL|nr:DUF2188 domain-containing protein [Asticcacaulis benevestitus]ESQ93914.1 hypothetical protein ABENE_04295 [Asticcacaulis benevestitus DSM 16100 = ATCC BAA-896]
MKVIYKVLQHDGGWAYQADGTYSETFASHDLALAAARKVAREQTAPGSDTGISYEDTNGVWHEELAHGGDRPETSVEG